MGLFSALGGLFGAGAQKKASRKAEAAQLAAIEKGIGEQRRQFDLTRSDYAPYLETGNQALDQQSDLVGLNGDEAQGGAIERLRASPLYQMLFDNGEETVLQNASATGGLRGGNTIDGLADFGRDTLAQVIERQLAQLGGLSGRGQEAVGSVSTFGANTANNVSGMLGQQGAVRAGGLLTRGGITAGMWNNAGSMVDSAVSAALGAGAGPGGAKFNFGSMAGKLF